jgi:hypothetical protein
MVSTRNKTFRSPSTKHINKKPTRQSVSYKSKYKLSTEKKNKGRITDHLFSRKQQNENDSSKQKVVKPRITTKATAATPSSDSTGLISTKPKNTNYSFTLSPTKMTNKDQDNDNSDGKDISDSTGSGITEHDSNTSTIKNSNTSIVKAIGAEEEKGSNSNLKEGDTYSEEFKTTESKGIHYQEKDNRNNTIPQDSREQTGITTDEIDSIQARQTSTGLQSKIQENNNKEETSRDETAVYSDDHRETVLLNNQEEEHEENKMSEDKSPNSNHNPEITYSKSRKGTEVLISDKDEQDLDKQMEIMVLNTMEENKNINKEAAMETDYNKSYSEIERTEEECKDRTQRIRRDDGSISSKKTVRNTNRHSDSEGSKINLDSPESEDDENTVDSSNSTQFNKKTHK